MSEYQYYEFKAIERPLHDKEKEAISKLSSRVQLTSNKASFNYSYGDFPANPQKILAQYFDALYYIANWGTFTSAIVGWGDLFSKYPVLRFLFSSCNVFFFCNPDLNHAKSYQNQIRAMINKSCVSIFFIWSSALGSKC